MVIFGSLLMVIMGIVKNGWSVVQWSALVQAVRWTLLYFVVCFFLEEVAFSGVLDAHLYRPQDVGAKGSAFGLAFLWGLWHLPGVPIDGSFVQAAFSLGIWHMVVGVPLAYSWRIGGSLLVPAAAHALLDGVRNAMLLVK
jgi:membrane protease YdiL (CAAX protease family)